MNIFDEMGVYWAEMADQNQTEEQLKFLKNHLKPEGYILDLACGTGRHIISLSKHGYCIVGLDVSANLLRIAKERSRDIQLVRGDIRFLPFKPQAFAATISMDTSFGYLPTEQDDRAALAEVQSVLTRKGIFIIDVFNRRELTLKYREDENQPFKQKEYPSFFLQQKRTVTLKGDWLCDLWIVRDKMNGRESVFEHTVRLYERSKLEAMLDKAGFAVEEVYGGYEGENFSSESPHLILITQKK